MMVRPSRNDLLHSASSAASFCAAAAPLSRMISCVSSLGADALASAASLKEAGEGAGHAKEG